MDAQRRSRDEKTALVCPLCAGTTFRREESRQDSRWGITSHVMILMVCERCSHVIHFYDHSTIFDFD